MSKRKPRRITTEIEKVDLALKELYDTVDYLVTNALLDANTLQVTLVDGVLNKVQHGLSRSYTNVIVSPPKDAVTSGRISLSEPDDRTKQIWLQADGYGADVKVTITVF